MSGPATTVLTATGGYRVVPDVGLRAAALVVAELRTGTGAAPGQVRATALTPLTAARATAGHLVVTGRADRALPHLATAPATVVVRLERPGRPPQHVELTIPAASPLPWRTTVDLDADPITLSGRVREAAFPHPPVPQAAVTVAGAAGVELVALRTPLVHPHPLGATVQVRTLTDVGGTTVADAVVAGADRLRLASTSGTGPATVLALGPETLREHARVLAVQPGGVVLLRGPLARSLPAGAAVRRCTSGAVGAATTLARAGRSGDGGLVTAAALAGDVLEVVDGAATELRATGAVSAPDGGWRLDGVPAVPAISLSVSAPGFVDPGPVVHPLDGGPAVLDVELTT